MQRVDEENQKNQRHQLSETWYLHLLSLITFVDWHLLDLKHAHGFSIIHYRTQKHFIEGSY